jgi:chemotaxis protein methyltransferase CheR
VLIYFDEPTKKLVLEKLASVLSPKGYLFLGASETIIGLTDKFKPFENERGVFVLV